LGRGADGELGTGDTENRFVPTRVKTSEHFMAISAGEAHTCALALDGRAFCWGWNAFYQRGNATDPRNSEPVPVTTTLRFKRISAGAHHTCAIGSDDVVYCWGYNKFGQNGDGTTNTGIEPVAVTGRLRADQISAGHWHTCAVAGEAAYCWGRNDSGQLGTGIAALIGLEPAVVRGAVRFQQVSAGAGHTCGVSRDGTAYCWGSNEYGELGDGSVFRDGLVGSSAPSPARIETVSQISAGVSYTCAVRAATANVSCWGRGLLGQLGIGETRDHYIPQPVHLQPTIQHTGELFTLTQLATGGSTHVCGIAEGSLYCWGTGRSGQLGAQDRTQSFLPQRTSR
jgi:alpha-tubulin suppressor-like RCC1 family protein